MASHYSTYCYREVDDNGTVFYLACHPELPGCLAQSLNSFDEARASLQEVRELYLRDYPLLAPEPNVITGSGMVYIAPMQTITR